MSDRILIILNVHPPIKFWLLEYVWSAVGSGFVRGAGLVQLWCLSAGGQYEDGRQAELLMSSQLYVSELAGASYCNFLAHSECYNSVQKVFFLQLHTASFSVSPAGGQLLK